MGQWWGGKSIPVAGLASVGIAPEYRGGGVALELLRQTLRELYNQQIPLFLTRNR
ncbi:GCN5-related N-acetyltransferase [Planktothrix tepida]|uniref:GCN5-related N-acetyltransferase n=2 Tax=Microcoleaceae TaxID=1892252 RepID=A0A9W4CFB0_9CYAN|nr:GCN5-related N-acetyltransferase [Planktothrix pseudagardhii]CAD5981580.1 GCN5-related N-acetyltransferase [Planktothrix tepida]